MRIKWSELALKHLVSAIDYIEENDGVINAES